MAKHDDQVKQLLAALEQKKLELGARPKAVLVTNGIYKLNDKEHVNLNTVNDLDILVKTYALIQSQHNSLVAAAFDLEIKYDAHVISGYTLAEWKQDFLYRAQVINWQKREAELNAAKRKLESLVSEDLKTEQALADLSELLTN